MDSVFIEPVIDAGLEVDVISKVSRPGASYEELCFVRDGMEFIKLFIGSFIIFANKSESISQL